jgi:hypothetical protein
MVGVIVDAQRMHCTKQDWASLLTTLSERAGRAIQEMHTRDFYAGNSPWRAMSGKERAQVIQDVCSWLHQRRHRLVFCALDKAAYHSAVALSQLPAELNTPWRFLGFHLALSLQKAHQRESRNKGHTLLILDNEERERMRYTDLLLRPQTWSDVYYNRSKKQEQLDQLIDVPYFADSKEVGLLQVADFVAFFLRRHAEIQEFGSTERYPGEGAQVSQWVQMLSARLIERRHVYPKKARSDAADLFWRFSPTVMRELYA